MNPRQITVLVAVLLVGLAIALFQVQNAGTMVPDLSLDIGFVRLHLAQPVSLPVLLWSTLGVGALVGIGLGMRLRSGRIAELERAVSAARANRSGGDAWD